MRALKRGLFGTGLLFAGAYGGLCYSFPEVRENPEELLGAAQRSSRFVWAAARLAYLYKYVIYSLFQRRTHLNRVA